MAVARFEDDGGDQRRGERHDDYRIDADGRRGTANGAKVATVGGDQRRGG
jgi:hypothetical protein